MQFIVTMKKKWEILFNFRRAEKNTKYMKLIFLTWEWEKGKLKSEKSLVKTTVNRKWDYGRVSLMQADGPRGEKKKKKKKGKK